MSILFLLALFDIVLYIHCPGVEPSDAFDVLECTYSFHAIDNPNSLHTFCVIRPQEQSQKTKLLSIQIQTFLDSTHSVVLREFLLLEEMSVDVSASKEQYI